MSEFKLDVSQDEGNGSHVFYVQCGVPLDRRTLQVAGLLLDGGYNPCEIEPLVEVAAAYVSVTEVHEASTVLHTTGRTPRELAEDNEKLTERVKVLEGQREELVQLLTEIAEAVGNDEPIAAAWASEALKKLNATEGQAG